MNIVCYYTCNLLLSFTINSLVIVVNHYEEFKKRNSNNILGEGYQSQRNNKGNPKVYKQSIQKLTK